MLPGGVTALPETQLLIFHSTLELHKSRELGKCRMGALLALEGMAALWALLGGRWGNQHRYVRFAEFTRLLPGVIAVCAGAQENCPQLPFGLY